MPGIDYPVKLVSMEILNMAAVAEGTVTEMDMEEDSYVLERILCIFLLYLG